jgi:hypothetical protein
MNIPSAEKLRSTIFRISHFIERNSERFQEAEILSIYFQFRCNARVPASSNDLWFFLVLILSIEANRRLKH